MIPIHIQHAVPATVFLAVARAQLVAATCTAGHGGRIRHCYAQPTPAYLIVGVEAWQKLMHDSTIMPVVCKRVR